MLSFRIRRSGALQIASAVLLVAIALGISPLSASAVSHAVQPSRLLDTRDATGGHKGKLAAGEVFQLAVGGQSGVGAAPSAVALNVTVVSPTGDGFLSAWPCGGAEPSTSNLNFVAGQIVANAVIVGVGGGGEVCLRSSVATDVVADISAWFDGSSPIVALAPNRLVDTRIGVGFAAHKLGAGEVLRVPVVGQPGVEAGAASAILNLTATGPDAAGFLTVYPCGQAVPGTSNLNVDGGRTVPNAVVATLAADGSVCVTTSVTIDVLVDLMGWIRRGGEAVAVQPARVLDTRNGVGGPKGLLSAPVSTAVLSVAGHAGVPGGTGLAILNITATEASADGFVTVYPCDRSLPNTSTLNIVRGRNVANLAIVPVSNDGSVCLNAHSYNGGAAHLVADVMGWLPSASLPAQVSTHFPTLSLTELLPSSTTCASRVRRAAENKRMNVAKNSAHVTPKQLAASGPLSRVDGNFTGTTDELLQWGACKWGLDEDVVRAMAAKESWWRDSQLGDMTTNAAVCAYGHTIGSDGVAGQCPQSIGLLQLNAQYYKDAFPEANVSNAYHLDYALAVWRSCYEGIFTWLNNVDKGAVYGAGDAWGCVGFWNAGRWHTAKGEGYVIEVKDYLTQRIWEQARFQEA